ncbi:MAG: prefoldin subunit beta [Candidatus Altiarchaeota archaeon]
MDEVEIPKQVQDKLIQFENLQKQLQLITLQKQQLLRQSIEIKNALEELEKIENNAKIYKVSGPLLIETTKEESKKKLNEEQSIIDTRTKMFEKEEKRLTEKLSEMRNEIQTMLKNLQTGSNVTVAE